MVGNLVRRQATATRAAPDRLARVSVDLAARRWPPFSLSAIFREVPDLTPGGEDPLVVCLYEPGRRPSPHTLRFVRANAGEVGRSK
jgi:hypothetical protein